MVIQQMLSTIFNSDYWHKAPLTCFVSNSYPYQFMRKMLHKIETEKIISMPHSRIQLSTQDPKILLPLLQQTILGQAAFFWLGDVEENFTIKQKELLLTGLQGYAGENRIALFVQEVPTKITLPIIQLPVDITAEEGIALAEIFAPKILINQSKLAIIESLFTQNQQFPLNLFLTILDSLELIHTKHVSDFAKYLTPLLPLSTELSNLSQSFFKRDRNFFNLWSSLSKEYPSVFWLAFWYDQWWRAFFVITFAQKKNIVLAKKMGFKLPYSFITRDWQSYQPEYFKNLLAKLYAIDYNIKQGYSFCFFDFLFAQHFIRMTK
ncbi:hypothetical protein FJ364_00020 [Candidatus Dependentiae bacterium]|nr:hypothetical protein [Candidatus Dependentiae bacterium]